MEANGNIRWTPRGKPSGGFHKQLLAGTLEYMAPEVLQKRPSSRAADVFAFAIVLNEIATGVVPYSDCTKDNPGCHTVLEMGYGRQELAAAVCGTLLRRERVCAAGCLVSDYAQCIVRASGPIAPRDARGLYMIITPLCLFAFPAPHSPFTLTRVRSTEASRLGLDPAHGLPRLAHCHGGGVESPRTYARSPNAGEGSALA